jgi:hypothetical protein
MFRRFVVTAVILGLFGLGTLLYSLDQATATAKVPPGAKAPQLRKLKRPGTVPPSNTPFDNVKPESIKKSTGTRGLSNSRYSPPLSRARPIPRGPCLRSRTDGTLRRCGQAPARAHGAGAGFFSCAWFPGALQALLESTLPVLPLTRMGTMIDRTQEPAAIEKALAPYCQRRRCGLLLGKIARPTGAHSCLPPTR